MRKGLRGIGSGHLKINITIEIPDDFGEICQVHFSWRRMAQIDDMATYLAKEFKCTWSAAYKIINKGHEQYSHDLNDESYDIVRNKIVGCIFCSSKEQETKIRRALLRYGFVTL